MSASALERPLARLQALVRADVRLQARQGFYAAYLVMSVVYVVALRVAPESIARWLLPLILLSDPALLGFYFVGGLLMLERQDRTLEALFVAPLHTREYLAAKAISLTLLALLCCAGIAAASGVGFRLLPLLAGVVLAAPLFVFIGIIAASRTASINRYMFMSILYVAPLCVPLIEYFGVGRSALWIALPMGAALRFFAGAVDSGPAGPGPAWAMAASFASLLLWNGVAYVWARRWFERHVIGRVEGV
jgi:fluoroquinolone transport system permease protein